MTESKSWTDTAVNTARSAADTARSAAPEMYDRSADAVDYEMYDRSADAVDYASRSIQEYPLPASVAMALLGYAVGFLFHHQWFEDSPSRSGRWRNGRRWSNRDRDWTDAAANTARSAAPELYDRSADAVHYASRSIQEYPLSGSVAMALLGYAIGVLFHHQWFEDSPSRSRTDRHRGYNHAGRAGTGRDWADDNRSGTETAADATRSATDTTR